MRNRNKVWKDQQAFKKVIDKKFPELKKGDVLRHIITKSVAIVLEIKQHPQTKKNTYSLFFNDQRIDYSELGIKVNFELISTKV